MKVRADRVRVGDVMIDPKVGTVGKVEHFELHNPHQWAVKINGSYIYYAEREINVARKP